MLPGFDNSPVRLNVLLVEDDEDDYLIASEVLSEISYYDIKLTWVESYDLGLSCLMQGQTDICFVDYRIGARTGLEFVEAAKARRIQVPIILLTGVGQHDIDIAAAQAGAADFIEKLTLTAPLVERSIRYALAHAKAMHALSEQTSLLETTLENTGSGIAALDASGKIIASNQLFNEILPHIIEAIGSELGLSNGEDCLARLTNSLTQLAGQLEIEIKDGHVYELRANRTLHGGSVVSILDISAQKVLLKNIERSKAEAEAASLAKSSFLANVSHELRTPLNGIIGFSDLIIAQHKSIDVIDYAEQINSGGHHLLNLINAILDYTKLESGQHPFDDCNIYDLDLIGDFAIRQVQPAADKRNITITLQIDDRLAGIRGDEMSLRRILINLLSNAVQYSHDGGCVEVSIAPDTNCGALIKVSDRGIGMEPQRIADAFLPFNQLHNTLDRQYEGTGLGLSIVQSLVRMHDGEVSIESAVGLGTTVQIRLPAERAIFAEQHRPISGLMAS